MAVYFPVKKGGETSNWKLQFFKKRYDSSKREISFKKTVYFERK